jgi:hypothetical protein
MFGQLSEQFLTSNRKHLTPETQKNKVNKYIDLHSTPSETSNNPHLGRERGKPPRTSPESKIPQTPFPSPPRPFQVPIFLHN